MTKQFDVGIYSFKRQVAGFICPEDDQKCKDGQIFGVLHPLSKVDFKGLYCFGVDYRTMTTKTLVRKNLRFIKVVTLHYERPDIGVLSPHDETWKKLNAVVEFLKAEQANTQLEIIPEPVPVSEESPQETSQ